MADNRRDFFISFNSADLAYAEAIDAALRMTGFTTYYHPRDLSAGGNIAIWMDEALEKSSQTLALYSPAYASDRAIYSKSERYATWWQDPGSDKRKLIPILIADTKLTPLMAPIKHIDVRGKSTGDAAEHVIATLNTGIEAEQRNCWRQGMPLPPIFKAAYRPNPNFKGRLDSLDSLHRSLRNAESGTVTAIGGMGGIGKTTLAAEYCHRFGGRYGGVWWIRAEQESTLLSELVELGARIGLEQSSNIESDARACLNHLATLSQPWLLVYDNAPNADCIYRWLPTGSVRCIITSRRLDFGDVATTVQLTEWAEETTIDYLLTRTRRHDTIGAKRLARLLDGLPLAAEQAAAFLSSRSGIGFDDYAEDISRLISLPRSVGSFGPYADTVYAAFVKSFELLESMPSGNLSLDILYLCAFLSPDGVVLEMVMAEGGDKFLPQALIADISDEYRREDALASLTSLSLVRREGGPTVTILIFHRLLLEVLRNWMSDHARSYWRQIAVTLISSLFPRNSFDNPAIWPICAHLMPHAAQLNSLVQQGGAEIEGFEQLLGAAGPYLHVIGDWERALAFAERSVELQRITPLNRPLDFATSLGNLAGIYTDLNQLEKAETVLQEALSILENHLATNNDALAGAISDMARVHWKRKQYYEAEVLLMRAAEATKRFAGEDSVTYGIRLSNLGALYCEWARQPGQSVRYTQEAEYKNRALIVVRHALGTRHPFVSGLRSNIAVMNDNRGDLVNAVSNMECAVAIRFSLALTAHPETIMCIQGLVDLWDRSGQPDKGARLLEGDPSDLEPTIRQIESEHRAWVAESPQNRQFGPRSPVTGQTR